MRSPSKTIRGYTVIFFYLLWVLAPIYMIVQTSIKPRLLIFSDPPKWIFTPTLEHYAAVFSTHDIGRQLFNSFIISVSTMAISVVIGSLAAYSFSRLKLRSKNILLVLIMFCRMVPATVLVIPIFLMMLNLKLVNTYWSLILADTTFNLPFVIWMMKSFFDELPEELDQAAMVDGCSRLGVFARIALPLAAPGLAATAVLCLLQSWNEFLFALVLAGADAKTLTVGIASFISNVSVDWGPSAAAAVLAMLPVFAFGLLVQRYLVRGLTMGAVKG